MTFIIIDHLDVVSLPGLLPEQHDGDAGEQAGQQAVEGTWILKKVFQITNQSNHGIFRDLDSPLLPRFSAFW